MTNLTSNKLLLFLFCVFAGCSTSSYKIFHRDGERIGLLVSADRILFSCEDVQDPENPIEKDGRYGFMALVLDEKNTITTFVQTSIVTKKNCLDRMAMFEKKKQKGKLFYIAGYGNLDKPTKLTDTSWTLANGKTYSANDRSFGFAIFKSEDGECFTWVDGEGKPCPTVEEFPHQNQPF
jgi:hypothetical protein